MIILEAVRRPSFKRDDIIKQFNINYPSIRSERHHLLSPPFRGFKPHKQTSPQPSPLPPFRGFKPDECKPEMNQQYDTDEEEFKEPNELEIAFTEPYSVLLTPRKRKRL